MLDGGWGQIGGEMDSGSVGPSRAPLDVSGELIKEQNAAKEGGTVDSYNNIYVTNPRPHL